MARLPELWVHEDWLTNEPEVFFCAILEDCVFSCYGITLARDTSGSACIEASRCLLSADYSLHALCGSLFDLHSRPSKARRSPQFGSFIRTMLISDVVFHHCPLWPAVPSVYEAASRLLKLPTCLPRLQRQPVCDQNGTTQDMVSTGPKSTDDGSRDIDKLSRHDTTM